MTTYRGIKCKTPDCENLIALGTFTQIQDRRVEFVVMLKPIQILCEQCHQTHSYENRDMVQFEGPPPPPDWPSF